MPVGPTIIVHGGAGAVAPDKLDAIMRALKTATAEGYRKMVKGGSAAGAVDKAIRCLEEGRCLNVGGYAYEMRELNPYEVQQEASIMDGSTMRSGGVGTLCEAKNPVKIARAVMRQKHKGVFVKNFAEFYCFGTEPIAKMDVEFPEEWREKYGTVGAVACDANGNVAAATSSGVPMDDLPQRIGNSAFLGLGTWADNTVGAISTTGDDESVMRVPLAYCISLEMQNGAIPIYACKKHVEKLMKRFGTEAGAIAVSKNGEVGFATTAPQMPLVYITNNKLHFGSSMHKIQTEPEYRVHLKRRMKCDCSEKFEKNFRRESEQWSYKYSVSKEI